MVRATSRQPSRIGRLSAGLVATIATIATLGGTPVALYALGRPLLPPHPPRWAAIQHTLTHPDPTGHVFATALLALGCLAWLTFAFSVIVELLARITNRRTWRLPGLHVQQRWAAMLVTTIALTFAAPGAAAFAVPVHATPVASVSPGTPVLRAAAGGHDQGVVFYKVNRGDYLGLIAERFEGHFGAYKRIAAENQIKQPNLIHTGDRIQLPSDVRDRGARTHASGVFVTPGQPEPSPPAEGKSGGPKPTGAAVKNKVKAGNQTTASDPLNTGDQRKIDGRPASSADAPAVDAVAIAGTLAGLIAAGAIAVKHREALQRRLVRGRDRRATARRPAARIPASAPPRQLRLMDPPRRNDLLRLDTALRVLAHEIGDWPVERVPQIMGAYLDRGDVTLMLAAETVIPPEPFVVLNSGWWSLPVDAILPAAPGALAPLPSLCTVGGRSEQHVLLDLEYLRALSIAGDAIESMNLMRYMVADLCHNVWSDDLRVCIAGFDRADADQLQRLGDGRIRVVESTPDAIDRFSQRFDVGVKTWNRPDAAPPNEILFIAAPSDDDLQLVRDFERALHEAPGLGLSVVVAPTPSGVARYHAEVGPTGTLSLSWLGSKTPAASLPASLMTEVHVQLVDQRDGGDGCPLSIARAASLALRRSTSAQPARLSGQHRRAKGVPAANWSRGVDLMRARHARPATA